MRLSVAALVLASSSLVACRSHDPARELALGGVETYWIVDAPQGGENYISPAVRFRLKNVSGETLGSVQARARFPGPGQDEVWGSIQEQVSSWSKPFAAGQELLVTVRSVGRYHSTAAPEDMLRSSGFQDPQVEVFVRIGSSRWAMLAQSTVERRIG